MQVELRLGDGLWLVLCDEGQLENALLNLAINARDAMAQPSSGGNTREAGARPDGGWLTISTGEAHLSAADLVADMGLPDGLDRRQVADAARRRRPGLSVLFMAGCAQPGTAGLGAELIGKPFPLDVLAERIGAVLEAARSGRG